MIKNVCKKTTNKIITVAIFIFTVMATLSTANSETNHFSTQWTGNPFNRMNIWVIGHSGQLKISDEIAIFDGDICVGARKIDQTITPDNPIIIVCSMNDNNNDNTNNGFIENNPILFRIWDSKNQKEVKNVSLKYFNISDGSQISPPVFTSNSDFAVKLNGELNNLDLSGDIDHSGKIDLKDILILLKIVTGFNATDNY